MEEKKSKKKIVKVSDILVIIIGIVLIIGGLYFQKNEEDDTNSWSTTPKSSESRRADEEGEIQGEDILMIVGFVISAFGLACIIKRMLDKKEDKVEEKATDTTSKLKELQKMLDDKLISEEEFNKKKKELIDKM